MYISCDPSVGPTRIIELRKALRLYPSLVISALGTKAAGSVYVSYVCHPEGLNFYVTLRVTSSKSLTLSEPQFPHLLKVVTKKDRPSARPMVSVQILMPVIFHPPLSP